MFDVKVSSDTIREALKDRMKKTFGPDMEVKEITFKAHRGGDISAILVCGTKEE